MAASSYKDICHELTNLNPLKIPKIIEQVPMPQVTELSKPLQQLVSNTSEKTVIKKFVQQLLNEGQSIHNINKEFSLPYNLIYKVTYGTKRPGGSQYQRKKAGSLKSAKQKKL